MAGRRGHALSVEVYIAKQRAAKVSGVPRPRWSGVLARVSLRPQSMSRTGCGAVAARPGRSDPPQSEMQRRISSILVYKPSAVDDSRINFSTDMCCAPSVKIPPESNPGRAIFPVSAAAVMRSQLNSSDRRRRNRPCS